MGTVKSTDVVKKKKVMKESSVLSFMKGSSKETAKDEKADQFTRDADSEDEEEMIKRVKSPLAAKDVEIDDSKAEDQDIEMAEKDDSEVEQDAVSEVEQDAGSEVEQEDVASDVESEKDGEEKDGENIGKTNVEASPEKPKEKPVVSKPTSRLSAFKFKAPVIKD
jgi:hypothetical protein